METATKTPAWAEANFKVFDGGGSFQAVRAEAFKRFQALGLPTTENEEWKYTNVSSLLKTPFGIAPAATVSATALDPYLVGGLAAQRLVFVNGEWNEGLSNIAGAPKGLSVESLKSAVGASGAKLREIVAANLFKHAAFEGHPFVALNTAFLSDGAVIKVERGAVIDTPIHLVHVTTGEKSELMTAPRVLIVAEDNA
ncbi:MAG: Fe-S cluster assembly protein SufD, partial [Pseudomonadota bacterium]